MGLSGRKAKQRIGNDPRNLAWADDAAKFGATYLSKFGWDASKGLGAEGEGRLSHIKVSQKLDMLGIGAAQQKDPNGIAWKQNKDFERVLERLNAVAAQDTTIKLEEDEDKKMSVEAAAAVDAVKPVVPRHRAHRARAIAAKNMASKSAIAISEILGVSSGATTPSATPEGTLTPCGDGNGPELITTSKKSVADYFKDKLLAKTRTSAPPPAADDEDAPRGGIGSSRAMLATSMDEEHAPRMGLGRSKLSSLMASAFSAASTSVLPVAKEERVVEMKVEEEAEDESRQLEKPRRKDKKGKGRDAEELGSEEVKKKKRRAESGAAEIKSEETDGPKQKNSKRRRDEDETADSKLERKKKKKRTDHEEEDKKKKLNDEGEEMTREERKRAKKEKKRLKANTTVS
ncbi:hypothetical protein C8F01DRAFT_1104513 [Mycena amicta]|nr:hypothetical protein C8F01DRAFT_1104513 [Mycena amicta]